MNEVEQKNTTYSHMNIFSAVQLKDTALSTKTTTTSKRSRGLPLFDHLVENVEICRDGILERVYFPVPQICSNLTMDSYHEWEDSIPRDTHSKKLDALNRAIPELHREMKLRESVRHIPVMNSLCFHTRALLNYTLLFLALAINVMLLFGYHVSSYDSSYNATLRRRQVYMSSVMV